jgi:hypothetical protein
MRLLRMGERAKVLCWKRAVRRERSRSLRKGGAVSMGTGAVFLIRVGLGVLFAFVMVKIFYPTGGIVAVVGFTVFLVGMAYLLGHLREKREEEGRGQE